MKITLDEFYILEKHILRDISFSGEGTFNLFEKEDKEGFDKKEAEQVKKTLAKIKEIVFTEYYK